MQTELLPFAGGNITHLRAASQLALLLHIIPYLAIVGGGI